ncbi:MAG: S-adenosylmethionine decarboxylase [Candidatus Magasanikbacteria bacterium]|nr:S-adenosylmethionine decarboxylase [Candidatus Magasanikbacteria bacterium]
MATKRYHNIVDIKKCKEQILDKKIVKKFIHEATQTCGMKILKGPLAIDGVPENPGVTTFAIIDFSHISIHTFSKDMTALIDIFSCKPYTRKKIIDLCKKYFATEKSIVHQKEVWWGK